MAVDILMPALSPTMEEGTLAKWLVKEGDAVAAGDVIAEIETDKATMEVEAVDEGKIGKIAVAEGTEGVKVNAVIAVLLEDGDSADATPAATAPEPIAEKPKAEEPAPAVAATTSAAPVAVSVASDPDIPSELKWFPPLCEMHFVMPWLKKCALMKKYSSWVKKSPNIRGLTKSRKGCWKNLAASVSLIRRLQSMDLPVSVSVLQWPVLRPIVEFMTFQFCHAGNRSDCEFCGQNALHVWRANGSANGVPWAERCCSTRWRATQPVLCCLVQPYSRPKSRCTLWCSGR